MDVLHAAGDLAADRQAVTVLEGAVRNGDVAAGIVRAWRVDRAALDRNVVIAHARKHVVDHDVAGTERVDGVSVRRLRCEDAQVAEGKIVRIVRNDLPEP